MHGYGPLSEAAARELKASTAKLRDIVERMERRLSESPGRGAREKAMAGTNIEGEP